MSVIERFMRYIQVPTVSDEHSSTCPSTAIQWELAKMIVDDLQAMGIADAHVDGNGYVYASLPANRSDAPAIGLIAHGDVSDGAPCTNIHARIVPNYDGGTLTLDNGDELTPTRYPDLRGWVGKDIIVTDGQTLLGADDKAGVAEIMELCARLQADPSIPHGKVCIAITPDEEIGRGADRFDIQAFGASYAYTVDGGLLGEINYENFHAASAKITIQGRNIHPGEAKNRMKNAALIAMEFAQLLPPAETPTHTEGYEGFYHLCEMVGDESRAMLSYLIRDHDAVRFQQRKEEMKRCANFLNERYGADTVRVDIIDSYRNMADGMREHMAIIERAERAFVACGVTPVRLPIRGGTDGARLTEMGLPCPNLSTGGMNFHGCHECIPVQDMERMVDVLLRLVTA